MIVSFKLGSGALGDFVCGYSAKIPSTFQVYGTNGSLILKMPFQQNAAMEIELNLKDRRENYHLDLDAAPFVCYQREVEYFCECIEQDKEPIPNGEIGLYALNVIAAIYKSAQSQRSVIVTKDTKPI